MPINNPSKETPYIFIINNHKIVERDYYIIESVEQLRRVSLEFLKNQFDYGYYKNLKMEYEYLPENSQSKNAELSDAEVELLPEHIKSEVEKDRVLYNRLEENRQAVLNWIESAKKIIKKNDDLEAWALICDSQDLGLYQDLVSVSLERLIKIELTV
jgi:hypothetical protein